MLHLFAEPRKEGTRNVRKRKPCPLLICVDDHRLILSHMTEYAREALPEAEVVGFTTAEEALAFAGEAGCDILVSEIELYGKPSGLALAREMQTLNPRVNVIFATVCSPNEYAGEVMGIRPSGYLTKVVEREELKRALDSLLYPVPCGQ